MDDVPHLALPLRQVGAQLLTVQQDTDDELAVTVAVICSFPLGSRLERPDFGIAQPELADRPLNVADIEQAVEAYEPRAEIKATEAPYDPTDPLGSRVRIEVAMARSEEEE